MGAIRWIMAGAGGIALAAAAALLVPDRDATAADHLDPPTRTDLDLFPATAELPADIADVYAWHDSAKFKLAMTFAGPRVAGLPPVYDSNVTYLFHLSNDGNAATDEATIEFRFGRDPGGRWGVQITGIPGATGPVVGPVQTNLASGTARAVAGLFDDPFVFDLLGFRETRATGVLSFRNDRNFFDGKNDTAVIVDFPRTLIERGTTPITVWVESRRIAAS